jgi:hypothetical protein
MRMLFKKQGKKHFLSFTISVDLWNVIFTCYLMLGFLEDGCTYRVRTVQCRPLWPSTITLTHCKDCQGFPRDWRAAIIAEWKKQVFDNPSQKVTWKQSMCEPRGVFPCPTELHKFKGKIVGNFKTAIAEH